MRILVKSIIILIGLCLCAAGPLSAKVHPSVDLAEPKVSHKADELQQFAGSRSNNALRCRSDRILCLNGCLRENPDFSGNYNSCTASCQRFYDVCASVTNRAPTSRNNPPRFVPDERSTTDFNSRPNKSTSFHQCPWPKKPTMTQSGQIICH